MVYSTLTENYLYEYLRELTNMGVVYDGTSDNTKEEPTINKYNNMTREEFNNLEEGTKLYVHKNHKYNKLVTIISSATKNNSNDIEHHYCSGITMYCGTYVYFGTKFCLASDKEAIKKFHQEEIDEYTDMIKELDEAQNLYLTYDSMKDYANTLLDSIADPKTKDKASLLETVNKILK